AYLKRLPDFDDVEAEERAMKHAFGFRSFAAALGFFTEWPDQARAAQLVLARASEIDGNLYYLLDPTARLIEDRHPLAATLLRRAMIEDTLDGAKSTRYKHAARQGLEAVLSRKAPASPAVTRIFDGEKEARLITLACSKPPEGY